MLEDLKESNCPEQPNKNLMIIEEIEGLISQADDKLGELNMLITMDDSKQSKQISQTLEEIDLFQKTTLFELRKTFE